MSQRPASRENRPFKPSDEQRAPLSPDQRRMETTAPQTERRLQGAGETGAEDSAQLLELPAAGFPPFEQPLTDWFRDKYRRDPTERELGAMMAAMNERDAPPPREGPKPDLKGWRTDLSAPPASRR